MERELVIVGASTRAAAQSAKRAGFRPWLADRFADVDLVDCGPVRRVEPYPWALADVLRSSPSAPWMYTGAMENYPDLIDRLAAERTLWGNSAAVVREVRDPVKLAKTLFGCGFRALEAQTSADAAAKDGTWLRKPVGSAGGRGIVVVGDETTSIRSPRESGVYFQKQIKGQPVSAVYVSNSTDVQLLGITTQLIGDDGSGNWWCTADWTGAKGYWYAGSVGPLREPPWLKSEAENLGAFVAKMFGLVGLFGIDAILTSDALWPLEVNPRYTASVEVLERATGLSAIELHAKSYTFSGRANGPPDRHTRSAVGKAILYASQPIQVPPEFPTWATALNANSTWPTIADIPHAGSAISTGAPICTVFAEAGSVAATTHKLRQQSGSIWAAVTATPLSRYP